MFLSSNITLTATRNELRIGSMNVCPSHPKIRLPPQHLIYIFQTFSEAYEIIPRYRIRTCYMPSRTNGRTQSVLDIILDRRVRYKDLYIQSASGLEAIFLNCSHETTDIIHLLSQLPSLDPTLLYHFCNLFMFKSAAFEDFFRGC